MKCRSNIIECAITELVKFINAHQSIPLILDLDLFLRHMCIRSCGLRSDLMSRFVEVKLFGTFTPNLKIIRPVNDNTSGEHS
ncbi:hypothetical protein Tco_0200777 [Tanacetum coccineum]